MRFTEEKITNRADSGIYFINEELVLIVDIEQVLSYTSDKVHYVCAHKHDDHSDDTAKPDAIEHFA